MSRNVVSINDPELGSRAEICVSRGFNCFRYHVAMDSVDVDVLWAGEGFESGAGAASHSGIPILFPYPGRIRGKTLRWLGRDYPLEGDDGLGNAIHGYVIDRPWRVSEAGEHFVVGEFQASIDAPELLHRWPGDFCISARYELKSNSLVASFEASNPGNKPVPFGFGAHPYFRVPFPGCEMTNCDVSLPFSKRWEMEDMIPTGRLLELPVASRLGAGGVFNRLKLDDVFSDLEFGPDGCASTIEDRLSGRRLTLRFDDSFRECVVYTPPDRRSISIEPLTCVPNAPELTSRGIDAGLKVLAAGEFYSMQFCINLS